jgi:hypothetical protein
MSVESRPLVNGQAPAARGAAASPLNRADLDRAAPWLRLLAGAALIAWSSYTTVLGVGTDFAPLVANRALWGIPLAVVVGVVVAGLLSLVQWLTSEHARIIYAVALLFDARYTQWQIGPWIEDLAAYHLRSVPGVAWVVSLVVSWALALLIARYGEILLFGRRR